MKKVLVVFGTRPEAIKLCPLIRELKLRECIETIICSTGQHRQMLDQVLEIFEINPDYDLDIMKDKQSLFDLTIHLMDKLKDIMEIEHPDLVLVHGDTTTAFVSALASFYLQIPVGHVEAGLRTHRIYSPFPEEFNRQAIDLVSEFYFAPTEMAKSNLLFEGKCKEKVFVTGNTSIDALHYTTKQKYNSPYSDWYADSKLILLTAHRRENIGPSMYQMFQAIRRITNDFPDVKVIYPVHKNPLVREIANKIFSDDQRILLIEPLDVVAFHHLIRDSHIILTDSGGIQEEAPSLGKPVLVMRDTTERPEGVRAGTLKLVGTREDSIYNACKELLSNDISYKKMSNSSNPYGDGTASKIIADIIQNWCMEECD